MDIEKSSFEILIPLSSQQVVRWHQSQQKIGWKNTERCRGPYASVM